jgi:hypothetical protein
MITELLKRFKYGYPIGTDYRMNLITLDQIEICYKEEKKYNVYIETMVDNSVIIYGKKIDNYYNNSNEEIDDMIFSNGVKFLFEYYKKIGKQVFLQ